MYAIRVETSTQRLVVTLSERLSTEEALRAVSQTFALAEAGNLTTIWCDLQSLERGPANLVVVAAALSARYQEGMRIAFIARAEQVRLLQRLVRFSGIRQGVNGFLEAAQAEAWLSLPARNNAILSSTGRRHARDLAPVAPATHTAEPTRRRGVA